jgi:hypothetical protein
MASAAPVQIEGLLALADRCEAATGPDRAINEALYSAFATLTGQPPYVGHEFLGQQRGCDWPVPRFTGSLDDAALLVPVGYAFGAGRGTEEPDVEGWAWCGPNEGPFVFAASPALALCAAALRARAATTPTPSVSDD